MNEQTTHTSRVLSGLELPSLYRDDGMDESSGGFSILEGLEPQRRILAPWPAWGALLVAVIGAALAVFAGSEMFHAVQVRPLKAASSEVKQRETIKAMPHPAVGSPAITATAGAAPIVIEASAGEDRAATQMPIEDISAREVAKSGNIGRDPLLQIGAAPVMPGPVGVIRTRTDKTKSLSLHVPAKSGKHDAANERKPARPAAKKGDRDVDLIAALLSHVSQPVKKKNETNPRSRPTGESGPSTWAMAQNRDVVLRGSGESLESVVSRCKSLGFIEGELCRFRICSDMWGKDPACPAGSDSASSAH